MKSFLPILILAIAPVAFAADFQSAKLSPDQSALVLTKSDGATMDAPRFDTQSGFGAPAISKNGHYAGWVADYSDVGASYAQALEVRIIDRSNRVLSFYGRYGVLHGWCFGPRSDTVIFSYSFPHGPTSTTFEMRRIEDGKQLQHFELRPQDADNAAAPNSAVPAWAKCAQPRYFDGYAPKYSP